MFQDLICEGYWLTFTIYIWTTLYRKTLYTQNIGVICNLLLNLQTPLYSTSVFRIFQQSCELLFHWKQKKLFFSPHWYEIFILFVPEILEYLLCTTNLCPFRLELEAADTSCFLLEALEYEILLAQNQCIWKNGLKIKFRDLWQC